MHTAPRKKWQYMTDNAMRGAYGETDYDRKRIRINKKRHSSRRVERISKKTNGEEHLGMTILHETLHARHPNMHEKTVRKEEKRRWKELSRRAKKRLYNKLK